MSLSNAIFISQLLCIVASSTASASSLRGVDQQQQQRELINTRIIGGNEAREGRYSYAVSLQDDLGHFCGGSLIAKDVVLSAAHCMQSEPGYSAVIGRHDLKSTADGEEIPVKKEITHEEYDWDTTDNDFMILILDTPTTEDVDLVTVSPNILPVDSAVTVMGWGDVDPAADVQTLAEELMETEVYVVSNEECAQSSGTVGGTEVDGVLVGGYDQDYHNQITGNMLCARDEGEDSCQGDSGGPLVLRQSSGQDVQVGVVSWGVSCAHEDFPGVYARVSSQYEWIRKHVCEGSSDPPAYFDCEDFLLETSRTQEVVSNEEEGDAWTTIVDEDFTTGLGLFNHNGNNARRYSSAKNRAGVVRLANGDELQSNDIDLVGSTFTRYRINFSFYAIEMEHADDLCLDYEIDNGAVTGEKCWSSLHAFENSRWYEDKVFEFTASSASTLKIRFRVVGDDAVDDVLLNSVTIQGQA